MSTPAVVRGKFKVSSTESRLTRRQKDVTKKKDYTPENMEEVEVKTVRLDPVYHNNDPEHENAKFWDASPSGKIELGMINPGVHEVFIIGKEYYVDFTLAE